jgi:cyclopropane-fatty-acyl-phospholipid synthase
MEFMASGEVDGERGRNGGIFDLVEKRSKVRTRELTRNELRDYALIEGREQFDKISSIGMFEAIGVSHFRTYFETVHRLDDLGRTIFNLELYGFEIHDVEGWRGRYPRTCRFWHDRLRARHDEACEEVREATTRVWLAYLAASSIAFQRNTVRIYQTLASKRISGAVALPPTRGDLYR